MSTTIDDLQIKIQGDSVKASASIDTLVKKLDRLSVSLTNIDNAKLGNLAGGVDKLGRAMQIMNTVKTSDFTRLAKNLNKLNNVNVANLKSVSKNILNVGNSIKGLEGTTKGAEQISQLAKAMAQLGYKSSTKAIENIPKLAVAMRQLMTELSKAPMVSNNLINMTNALAKLARTGASSGKAATSLSKSLNVFSSASNMATKSSFSLASAIGKVYATYFLLFRAFGKIREAINLSSALTEVQNVVDVTFKDMSYKVEELAKTSIEQFGLSELSLKQFASRFQAMGSAMKIDPTAISGATKYLNEQTKGYVDLSNSMSDVSLTLTKLTADMASFYNVEQVDVAQDLESIFTGMTRPLRAYGLDLTEATLKEWALRNGINANIDSMSQAQKTMLRYQYVLANTTNAQGDFLRTQDTWANQTRILKQNFEQLGIVIGRTFINMLKPAVSALNQLMSGIIKFAQTVSNALGKIFGWKYEVSGGGVASDMEDASIGAEDMSDSLGNAVDSAKKLKKYLLGIDELNILGDKSDTSSNGGSTGGGVSGGAMPTDGWVQTDGIIENFKSELSSLYAVGTYVSSTISDALEKIDWTKVYEKASNFGKGLADFLNGLISPRLFGDLGKTIAGAINTAILAYKEFWTNFDGTNLGLSVANGINQFFKTIKAKDLAEGMNAFVDTMEDAIGTAITNIDWKTVFSKIGDFLGSLDADTVLFFLGVHGIKKFGKQIGTAINKQLTFDAVLKVGKAVIKLGKNITGKLLRNNFISTLLVAFGQGAKSLGKFALEIAVPVTVLFAVGYIVFNAEDVKANIQDLKQKIKNIKISGGEGTTFDGEKVKLTTTLEWKLKEIKWDIQDWEAKVAEFPRKLKDSISSSDVFSGAMENMDDFKTHWSDMISHFSDQREIDRQNMYQWVDDTKTKFDDLAQKISDWYTNSVAPWFTQEKWQTLGKNMIDGIKSKWKEFSEWWKSTGIYNWWTKNVAPWFTSEKWNKMSDGIRTGLQKKWNDVKDWWKNNNTLSEWKVKILDMLSIVKNKWQNVKDWWKNNNTLSDAIANIKLPHLVIDWDLSSDGAKVLQKLGLKGFPSFKVDYYQSGGFIPNGVGSLFVAGENGAEIVGNGSRGTDVLNQGQIGSVIHDAVVDGMMEVMMSTNGMNASPVVENVLMVDSETVYRIAQKGKQSYNGRYTVVTPL